MENDEIKTALSWQEGQEEDASWPPPNCINLTSAAAVREIPGRYIQVREQGSGGIGRVLRVKDMCLGREIALKELLCDGAPHESTAALGAAPSETAPMAARFLREARITAQLEHPSIVPIYEMGQRSDGTLYYTMKLIRGRTLEKAIEEADGLSERLGLLPHFIDLCQAIAYAHSQGVIHRDIKPSNVLVGEFGETVVIDWGLAVEKKEIGACDEARDGEDSVVMNARLTRYGQRLGTPRYMAPEQAAGKLEQIAEPSDVYALGVALYEILTGAHPFGDSTDDNLLQDIAARDPVPIRLRSPKAPAELAAICERAMRRDPEERYPHAGKLAEELKRFQEGALVEAYQYNSLDRMRRFVGRHAWALSITAAVCAAVFATGLFAAAGILREQTATERALYRTYLSLAYNAVDNDRLEEAEDALLKAPVEHRGLEWGLVKGLCHPERLVLQGHRDVVNYAAYSADGARIITCDHDGRVRVWDARNGAMLHEMIVWDEFVHRVLWSGDGALLIVATRSERTIIYDAHTFEALRELAGYAPALTPDGRTLALATKHGEIIVLYDPLTGEALHAYPRLPKHQIHLAFSPDGTRLAAAADDGCVRVWALYGEAPLWSSPPVHLPSARYVDFSPDGAYVLTAGADRRAILWDAASGKQRQRFEGHEAGLTAAEFLPSGRHILTASKDRTLRIWDAQTGRETARHGGFSSPLEFAVLSPDGTEFITHMDSSIGHMAAVVRPIIPLEERNTLRGHSGPVNAVDFSPDDRLLASGAGSWRYEDDDRIMLWNTADNTLIREIVTGHGPVHSVRFFANGARIASGNQDGTASFYDVESGKRLRTFVGHEAVCRCVAFNAEETLLATAGWDGVALVWDVNSGERRLALEADPHRLDVAAFHHTQGFLATGGMDGRVRFWDAASGERIGILDTKGDRRVSALSFSPDGETLATGGDRGRVTLWDVGEQHLIREFQGHKSIVYALAFSADGRRLITAGRDAAIWIWEVDSGNPVMFLERHRDTVNALALRSDSGMMVAAGDDALISVWPIAPWAPF